MRDSRITPELPGAAKQKTAPRSSSATVWRAPCYGDHVASHGHTLLYDEVQDSHLRRVHASTRGPTGRNLGSPCGKAALRRDSGTMLSPHAILTARQRSKMENAESGRGCRSRDGIPARASPHAHTPPLSVTASECPFPEATLLTGTSAMACTSRGPASTEISLHQRSSSLFHSSAFAVDVPASASRQSMEQMRDALQHARLD